MTGRRSRISRRESTHTTCSLLSASQLAAALHWGGSFLVAQTFPLLYAALGARCFLLNAVAVAAALGLWARAAPETRAKSLDRIQAELACGFE